MRFVNKLLILAGILQFQLIAQPVPKDQYILTELRGVWEYHSYYEKFTINFQSDSRMLFNNKPSKYSLSRNELRITTKDDEITYKYKLKNDSLSLSVDGKYIRLHHVVNSENEHELVGRYYTFVDSLHRLSVTFRENGEFSVSRRLRNSTLVESVEGLNGIFRAEDDNIYLLFADNTLDKAEIYNRDLYGQPECIVYQDRLYDKELIIPEPLPLPYPGYDPPPPPPPPPHPRPPIENPIDENKEPMPQPKDGKRDDGAKRDDQSKRDNRSSDSLRNKRPD